jgi:starch-binding outer membrane protein, SusD/RagB family
MKVLNKLTWLFLTGFVLCTGVGCKKVINEVNRSNIAPDYFKTPGGVDAAVIAMYSNLRNWYGQEGMALNTMIGTDEHVAGFGTTGNFHTYTLLTNDGAIQSIWDWSYRSINNANGVLEFAPIAGISAAEQTKLVAEAKFMRAYYYFMLVTTFGEVSISTSFVTSATTAAKREPIAAVYDIIVKDLNEALADLPAKPTPTQGRAGKAAALHLLSKVYLTRGWSSAAKATDFTDAYNTANQLITNKATYGVDLWADFADIWKEANDYSNKEIIFMIDRNTDPKGAETTGFGTGNPGGKFNGANFYQRPNYPIFSVNLNGGITGAPAFLLNGAATVTTNPIDRDVAYGRPFGRVRPSNYTLNTAFSDKTNDTRYNKTFQTVYIFNRPGPLAAQTPINITVHRAANPADPMGSALVPYTWVKGVDTGLILTGKATVTEAERRASKAYLMTTNQYDVNMFPSMKKHDDVTRAHTNDASDRPFPLMRFGETYLLAAEAAFKAGNLGNAKNMINVIRARAGALPITEADITLDFILDERTRELFGEWMRWYDLVRTKSLEARLTTYNPISNFRANRDYLRPVPQTQIDLVTTGPKYPQNPNY